ncbi:MATE family efflux transporter [Cetobacterium sp. 2A]|uniref:MATE family efflux transporter n=1 Tax=Cetobacterium sp. 2A TaxID=2754723 RepID=UPI00163D3045|nr:MATE family efflux transporter [Cetobacterium sp. 2A]MBC2857175.1 MATE family efflux transporter [Cetobacterium sp. 2A]
MFKQFTKYVFPSVLAMFISSLYVIVDGIFVGKGVGDLALGAVNLILPLSISFFGIATMFAVGGGTLISSNFGRNKINEGVLIFRQAFKFLIILSFFLSLIGVVFAEKIVIILGATQNMADMAATYLRYYTLFCIPNIIGIALNSFIRNDGNPKLAMLSTILGALTNVLLDYIFIFIFQWGIKGAAIATGLGQLITISVILFHFILKKGHLSFKNVTLDFGIIKEFVKIGFPSFFAEITFSMIIFCMNIVLVKIGGETGLAAFSIINYLTTNIYMILLGLAFGVQPLISYNLGAKNPKAMISYYKMTIITSVVINFTFWAVCYIFGMKIIQFFSQNTEIIRMAYSGLNIINVAFFLVGINLATTIYYQSIGNPSSSNVICIMRSILFLPIILFILSKFLGINGIWISMIISELLTLGASGYFFKINISTYNAVKSI